MLCSRLASKCYIGKIGKTNGINNILAKSRPLVRGASSSSATSISRPLKVLDSMYSISYSSLLQSASLVAARSVAAHRISPSSFSFKRFASTEAENIEEKSSDASGDETNIENFRISKESLSILKSKNITKLFPIQYECFDAVYDGKDVIGRARTGTGKTLAFALPILESFPHRKLKNSRFPKVLILEPTRELARQTGTEFETYGKRLRTLCIYGGSSFDMQDRELKRGVDVIVGTPGRIVDLLDRGWLSLEDVQYIVLDEADEMLKIGFQEAVEHILSQCPGKDMRQLLLFSATMPPWVRKLADKHINNDVVVVDLVEEERVKSPENIKHYSIEVNGDPFKIIDDLVTAYSNGGKTLVFCRTKADVNEVAMKSSIANRCSMLHGDISQAARERVMDGFKRGNVDILVATDVAARGLDIPNVELVIQVNPPQSVESYIHRSGRTGRAGRSGTSVLVYDRRDLWAVKDIESKVGITFQRHMPPSMSSIISRTIPAVVEEIKGVSTLVLPYFTEVAEKLIKEFKNPTDAVAAALAQATGMNKTRSLDGEEDFVTVQLYKESKVHSKLQVMENLRDVKLVKNARLCADGSVLIDVRSKELEAVMKKPDYLKSFGNDIVELKMPLTLPELDASESRSSQGSYNRGQSSGFRDRSRSYGSGREERSSGRDSDRFYRDRERSSSFTRGDRDGRSSGFRDQSRSGRDERSSRRDSDRSYRDRERSSSFTRGDSGDRDKYSRDKDQPTGGREGIYKQLSKPSPEGKASKNDWWKDLEL